MPATTSHPLPERPNFEQLRKIARERQRETAVPLHAVQLEVARYFGFGSWPRLREHVLAIEARTWSPASLSDVPRDESPAHRFLRLTTVDYGDGAGPDPAAARLLLASVPGLPAADLAVAAVSGDLTSLRTLAAAGDVDRPVGPFGWPALMYLAYSRLDVGEATTLDAARVLLAAGADPDEGRYFLGYPTPFTVLTGVFGDGEDGQPAHPHALALARVLLDAGADPNDGQALYNRMFGTDDDFLSLLFEYGLGTGDGGPWRRRLPELSDSPAVMLRRLLDWAVSHGQLERVGLLAQHGLDVVSPDPDGRTPIAVALANGHRQVAELLRQHGAERPVQSAAEQYVGAVLAGDRAAAAAAPAEAVAAARSQRPGLMVWAAAQGRTVAIEILAEAGFDVDALARGDVPVEQPWQTALHSAVEHDHRDVVALLLRLGARVDVRDARYDGTPADWARHFDRPHLVALLEGGAPGSASG